MDGCADKYENHMDHNCTQKHTHVSLAHSTKGLGSTDPQEYQHARTTGGLWPEWRINSHVGDGPILFSDIQTKLGMLCAVRKGTLKAQIPGVVQSVPSWTVKGDEEIYSTERMKGDTKVLFRVPPGCQEREIRFRISGFPKIEWGPMHRDFPESI